MRLSRVRFTVRRLMVAVAVVAFGLWVYLGWDTDTGVSLGVGHVRIPIVFLIEAGIVLIFFATGGDLGQWPD